MPTSGYSLHSRTAKPNLSSRSSLSLERGGRELPKRPPGRQIRPTQAGLKTGSMINISIKNKEEKVFRPPATRYEILEKDRFYL